MGVGGCGSLLCPCIVWIETSFIPKSYLHKIVLKKSSLYRVRRVN